MNNNLDVIKKTLATVVKYSNLTNAAFERKLGWSNGYLNKALKSGNITSDKVLDLFAFYPEISKEWLFTASGNMIANVKDENSTISSNLKDLSTEILEIIEQIDKDYSAEVSLTSKLKSSLISLLNEVSVQKEKLIKLHETNEKLQGLINKKS